MLEELDPHSTYISKEEVDKMNEPLKGNFEGVGISFNIYKGHLDGDDSNCRRSLQRKLVCAQATGLLKLTAKTLPE